MDLFLTAAYELHVPDVVPGSERAREIQDEYSALWPRFASGSQLARSNSEDNCPVWLSLLIK